MNLTKFIGWNSLIVRVLALLVIGSPLGLMAQSFPGDGPCGFYALDSAAGEFRESQSNNIEKFDFIDGYVSRLEWPTFEPNKGKYNFNGMTALITLLQAKNKKLSLNQSGPGATYLATDPTFFGETWKDGKDGDLDFYAPWDWTVQNRFYRYVRALSKHLVLDSSQGVMVPLAKHPTMETVHFGIPGIGRVREYQRKFKDIPGYTRAKFIGAVVQSMLTAQRFFPKQFHTLAVWKIEDDVAFPTLTEELISTLASRFDGIRAPKITIMQDNLAASSELPNSSGIITGYPSPGYAVPVALAYDSRMPTGFQMLSSWRYPWDAGKVAKTLNTVPVDAVDYAEDSFWSKYFEIYAVDLKYPPNSADFRAKRNIMCLGNN